MSGIGMNGNEALKRILEYVSIAKEAVDANNDKAVIRLTKDGQARKVETCSTDSVKSFTHLVRSGENKHKNNETRNDFRDCVLRLFGKEKLSQLPRNVQEILLPSKFEHTGKPLTASRIMKVFNNWVDNTFKPTKGGRDEYVKILLDPAYRKEMADQARARGGIERILQNSSVDLNEKCPCTTVTKLCALHGDIGNKVPEELEKLGLKSCGVNYADNTCAGGGILVWNTQEEKLISGMSPDVFALLLEEDKLEVGYDDVQKSAVFHYADSLTGGLSPADDPFLLVFKKDDKEGKERTILNMAMPNLSYKMSSFDKNNFCIRMLDTKKREFGAEYDAGHKEYYDNLIAHAKGEFEQNKIHKKYNKAKQNFINEQMALYTDKDSPMAAKVRKNFGEFSEKFHKLIYKDAFNVVTKIKDSDGNLLDTNWESNASRTPLGFNEKESKLAMMLAEYGGSAMGIDLASEDVDVNQQAKNVLAKAVQIVKAQQKAEAGTPLTDKDRELLAIRDKAQKNYENNIYEEFAKGIVKARKMGLKALPMGKIGCGVFGNDPKLTGKMLAKAFLDYGGDMILVANGYSDDDNEIAKVVIESFNAYLKEKGYTDDQLLTLDQVNDKERLKSIAKEITDKNPEANNELPNADNNQNLIGNDAYMRDENDFNLLGVEPNAVPQNEGGAPQVNNDVRNQNAQNANEFNLLGRESGVDNRESVHQPVNNNGAAQRVGNNVQAQASLNGPFPDKKLFGAKLPKPQTIDKKAQNAGKATVRGYIPNNLPPEDDGKYKSILQIAKMEPLTGRELLYGPLSFFAGNLFFGEKFDYKNANGQRNISKLINGSIPSSERNNLNEYKQWGLNGMTIAYKNFQGSKKDQIKALLYDYRNLLMECVGELADKSARDRIENKIYGFLSEILTRLDATDEQDIPNYK